LLLRIFIRIANGRKGDYLAEGTVMGRIRVVMYTRAGCHLCDDAWQMLGEFQARFALDLKRVDVDTDADLARMHGERVPVIEVNGKERFWGRINRVLLQRQLSAE
jgi:glutaredoxin